MLDVLFCTASILNLVAISLDRYMAVTRPISYAKRNNLKRVRVSIAIVWTMSFVIALPVVCGLNEMYELELNSCASNNPVYVISSSVGSFYVPALVLLAVYQRIFRLIHERHKQMDKSLSIRSESHCESSEDRATVLANPIAKRFQASSSNTTETTRQITHITESATATVRMDDQLSSHEHKDLTEDVICSAPCFILTFVNTVSECEFDGPRADIQSPDLSGFVPENNSKRNYPLHKSRSESLSTPQKLANIRPPSSFSLKTPHVCPSKTLSAADQSLSIPMDSKKSSTFEHLKNYSGEFGCQKNAVNLQRGRQTEVTDGNEMKFDHVYSNSNPESPVISDSSRGGERQQADNYTRGGDDSTPDSHKLKSPRHHQLRAENHETPSIRRVICCIHCSEPCDQMSDSGSSSQNTLDNMYSSSEDTSDYGENSADSCVCMECHDDGICLSPIECTCDNMTARNKQVLWTCSDSPSHLVPNCSTLIKEQDNSISGQRLLLINRNGGQNNTGFQFFLTKTVYKRRIFHWKSNCNNVQQREAMIPRTCIPNLSANRYKKSTAVYVNKPWFAFSNVAHVVRRSSRTGLCRTLRNIFKSTERRPQPNPQVLEQNVSDRNSNLCTLNSAEKIKKRVNFRATKQRSVSQRERKATKTLAIVLGAFLVCWLPFFTVNVTIGVCLLRDVVDHQAVCQFSVSLMPACTWLGYVNSLLNPIIYTIFNLEFRIAFKKLLHLNG
ncbi:hypothetical protein EG68_02497 [Paragonimus skrjabini miyazakii]|uniref:G-protein coupled receptors family 1 profile domain-containing protein n=1 Tax=Paragonimus skrjabini miyazakii TaxID=59628 RepID=A0A8S9YYS5_9TREM|nr:hypothetical protein EG68_02497 [Paragonimus skrjabini miyazakii]